MTAQGHPRAIFRRAIERGNLVAGEARAHEDREPDARGGAAALVPL